MNSILPDLLGATAPPICRSVIVGSHFRQRIVRSFLKPSLYLALSVSCFVSVLLVVSNGYSADSVRVAVNVRGDLDHSRAVFTSTGKGRVAFIGGSITEMNGYRPMVMKNLQARFPQTKFEFINAGIASTCSHSGAFRLPHDVLSQQPDLLFIEFAVNDDQDAAHSYDDAVRGMEGIIRNARTQVPKMDIVVTHFVNKPMLGTVQAGSTPTSIRAHEAVAEQYGISSCNVAVELANQIAEGKTTWEIYGGVHPKPAGNQIAAGLIEQVFQKTNFSAAASSLSDDAVTARPLPPPLDPSSFSQGRFLSRDAIALGDGWSHQQPDWKKIPGSFRVTFANRPLRVATQPGSTMELQFTGTAVGLFVLAGPDAGTVEYSIDGGTWKTADLYHRFSKRLHYPRTVVLQSGLANGKHQVKLRVAKTSNQASKGTAIRVLEFVAS